MLLMVWSNTLVSTANRWRWHSGSGGKGSARRSQQAEMFGRIGCSQACQVVSGSHYISTPPYPQFGQSSFFYQNGSTILRKRPYFLFLSSFFLIIYFAALEQIFFYHIILANEIFYCIFMPCCITLSLRIFKKLLIQ